MAKSANGVLEHHPLSVALAIPLRFDAIVANGSLFAAFDATPATGLTLVSVAFPIFPSIGVSTYSDNRFWFVFATFWGWRGAH